MSSSELSNALNPHVIARPRKRHVLSTASSTAPVTPTIAAQLPRVPHRSELELAIVPPPLAVDTEITQTHILREQQAPRNVNPLLELYRVIASARDAAAAERDRRIAWEREQEAKSFQRQAEMERQIMDMREEINLLKAYISLQPHARPAATFQAQGITDKIPSIAHRELASPDIENSPQTPLSPISPVPHHPPAPQAAFVEGSSSGPLKPQDLSATYDPILGGSLSPSSSTKTTPHSATVAATQVALRSVSSDHLAPPTPQSTGPSVSPMPLSPRPHPAVRKRPRYVLEDDSDYTGSSAGEAGDSADRRRERRNGHDSRCLTIHHAMRIHIRKMMKLKPDDELPESHFEGAPLLADQPVRFVWNRTIKQSAHNAAMKRRVVDDLMANRARYKHVEDKEFSKKNLEIVFDQAFTTLRQRYKAQSDTAVANRIQRKENQKALKARRLQRKKMKLSNRVEARKKLDAFAQPVFETALQQECMSSEESDGDYVENGEKVQVFRTRGPSWRSTRFLRYLAILDEQDRIDKGLKPKRGVGRRVRREGPPKEGLFLPPKGVARWMVSRRWLQETEAMRPDLVGSLRELVADVQELENEVARVMLGAEESDDESAQEPSAAEVYAHVSDASYSLHNALEPV
ncbi:hypothetical protein BN946_scf184908.g82 [Trametes cinnabarina]|uniref:Uncharacterized protein n=1 Tax=Pycnoporus cinnabarinus TaxID=5643 RepID=A0A060SGI5_PYCCI|nr:hypothetical protein BN946_scf184908.g82 [Trametes cinnabarina]